LPGTVFPQLPDYEIAAHLLDDPTLPAAPDIDVLSVEPEMRAWLDERLPRKRGDKAIVESLADLFTDEDGLQLTYEPGATLTASEAFARREGNCLSYANLFIAFARASGIDARYLEVPGRPTWDTAGNFIVVNRHIVAYGRLNGIGDYTVDLGDLLVQPVEFGTVVSDDAARAQYFNNLGARALIDGKTTKGLQLIYRALLIDADLPYVWTNLATAYMQLERFEEAEAALVHSLKLDHFNVTALNQAQRLYERLEKPGFAAYYRERAERARYQNPYVRFGLAVSAWERGDPDRAVAHLKRAVKDAPNEPAFRALLGRFYTAMGQVGRGRQEMRQAIVLARSVEDRSVVSQLLGDLPVAELDN
jgi:tetratricopeptide (TPR) repeat protein